MTAEAKREVVRKTSRTGGSFGRRRTESLGPFSTAQDAIEAIRSLDGRFAVLAINLKFVPSAPVEGPRTRSRPNADLAEALLEGRTLEGRFSSAVELFHALEAKR